MILINAQENRVTRLGVFSRYVPLAVPIGIGVLASYLMEKGHHVKIWDDAIKEIAPEDILELSRSCEKPYIFGVSCMTASIARGFTIARYIKEVLPDAKIVFGGIHPTV